MQSSQPQSHELSRVLWIAIAAITKPIAMLP